jgi:hypothetical protein
MIDDNQLGFFTVRAERAGGRGRAPRAGAAMGAPRRWRLPAAAPRAARRSVPTQS